MMLHVEDENTMVLLEAVMSILRRLRELAAPVQGKGKGRDMEPGDEVWGCLTRLADTLKKSDGLKALLNTEEVVQW
jgi:rapamycin-insensitive companion of mTOR